MKRQAPKRSLLAVAIATAFAPAWAQPTVTTATVEVVGTTPLAGIGVPRLHLPSNVLSLDDRRLDEIESLNIAEQLQRQAPAVTVNEIQGNPYQADLNYRGFTASPLLGTAQGLSIYVDGVRVNEPFGDTVNWDLIPHSAISGIDLIPGSNPAFGLNTLGGALAIRTKSGFSHPGAKLELSGGSFGRSNTELAWGGNNGTLGWYVAGDWFREDGWRDYSPSDVKQFFGKLSFRNSAGEADLTLTQARSRLIGNGLVPQSLLSERREAIFTHPDQTRNDLTQIGLNGRLWLSDSQSLSGNAYVRKTRTRTLNGDMNDDYEDDWATDPNTPSGAHNRTRTRQLGSGASVQWNLATKAHQLAVGASWDQARMRFAQTQQLGSLNASRGIDKPSEREGRQPAVGYHAHGQPVCHRHLVDHSGTAPDRLGALQHEPGHHARRNQADPAQSRRRPQLPQAQPGPRPELADATDTQCLRRFQPGQPDSDPHRARLRRPGQPVHPAQLDGCRPLPQASRLAHAGSRPARQPGGRYPMECRGLSHAEHRRHPVSLAPRPAPATSPTSARRSVRASSSG